MVTASLQMAGELIPQARRMARLARAGRSESIVVLGVRALALTIELCRDGFQEVVCGCRFGLPCALEHSSTVLVTGPANDEELRSLLRDACSILGRRGRLVLQLASIDQDRAVEAQLRELGVQITSAVYDLSREVLVCHQLEPSAEAAPPAAAGVRRQAA